MWRYDIYEITLNGKNFYVVSSQKTDQNFMDDYICLHFKNFSTLIGKFFLGETIFQKITNALNENKLINEESYAEVYEFLEITKADFYDYLAYSDGNRSSDKEVI